MEANMNNQPSEAASISQVKRGFFSRAWHGEEKLWKVFWLYGVLLGMGLSILMLMMLVPVLLASIMMPIFGLVPFLILLPYYVWNGVSVWRCAWNVKLKFWGYLARIIVILGVLNTVYSIGNQVMGSGKDKLSANVASSSTTTSADGSSVTVETHKDGSTTTTTKKDGAVSVKMVGAPIQIGTGIPGSTPQAAPVQPVAEVVPTTPGTSNPVAPITAAPVAPTPIAPAIDGCEQRMTDAANQYHVDPKTYIAQNQAWLAQCRQSMAVPQQSKP